MNNSNTLVFRWVGKHIEGKLRKDANPATIKLTSENRSKYIQVLCDTLENGLYAQPPKNDSLGDGFFETNRPCICFTSLAMQNVADHCRLYGRMGFGFTKQFIAKNGGGPVHYTLGTEKDPTVRALKKLKSLLNRYPQKPKESGDLDYIMHFFKRLRETKSSTHPPSEKPVKKEPIKRVRQIDENTGETRCARYPVLKDLDYLEENEWRLVYTATNKQWINLDETQEEVKARFQFKTGLDLQTVVLPDNLTVQKVLNNTDLPGKLFKPGRPPVQLISLESLLRLP